jgi:hypothetical protein
MILKNGCYNGCEDGQQVLKMFKNAGRVPGSTALVSTEQNGHEFETEE